MRIGSTMLALALAAWGAAAEPAWAIAGCDAFPAALRAGASDMGVEFWRAIVVSRTRSDAIVFDVTTSVDVDATLTCRGDQFLRFEARIGEPANARTTTNFERFQTAALKAALGWDAGKSRGVLKGMSSDASEYLAASRQRGDVYIAGKTEEHEPGGVSLGMIATGSDRTFVIVGPAGAVMEVRFHHLERRRVDQALPRLLERAQEEGRRVVVRASSEEMVAALNERLWTYDDASFLPHGAAGDGDPMTQPIFLTYKAGKSQRRDDAGPAVGRRRGRDRRGVRSRRSSVRRARRGRDQRGAERVEAAQG